MDTVTACEVPPESLLAGFGEPDDYRDCFCREVAGAVGLGEFIERFYGSAAFRPERTVLGLMGRRASREHVRALARGEADRFGVWEVVERRSAASGPQGRTPARSEGSLPARKRGKPRGRMAPPAPEAQQREEILLLSRSTGTASWLAVEPLSGPRTKPSSSNEAVGPTRMYFGSWVGTVERTGWRFMLQPHLLYSRMLLGAV